MDVLPSLPIDIGYGDQSDSEDPPGSRGDGGSSDDVTGEVVAGCEDPYPCYTTPSRAETLMHAKRHATSQSERDPQQSSASTPHPALKSNSQVIALLGCIMQPPICIVPITSVDVSGSI